MFFSFFFEFREKRRKTKQIEEEQLIKRVAEETDVRKKAIKENKKLLKKIKKEARARRMDVGALIPEPSHFIKPEK